MPIDFACDACGKSFHLDDSMGGRKGRCTACGAVMRIPAAAKVRSARDQDNWRDQSYHAEDVLPRRAPTAPASTSTFAPTRSGGGGRGRPIGSRFDQAVDALTSPWLALFLKIGGGLLVADGLLLVAIIAVGLAPGSTAQGYVSAVVLMIVGFIMGMCGICIRQYTALVVAWSVLSVFAHALGACLVGAFLLVAFLTGSAGLTPGRVARTPAAPVFQPAPFAPQPFVGAPPMAPIRVAPANPPGEFGAQVQDRLANSIKDARETQERLRQENKERREQFDKKFREDQDRFDKQFRESQDQHKRFAEEIRQQHEQMRMRMQNPAGGGNLRFRPRGGP